MATDVSLTLGPHNADLVVRTGREGLASAAGHDLTLAVTDWSASLSDSELTFRADPTSLRVRQGTGGVKPLGEPERVAIEETIRAEVLADRPIEFRSAGLAAAADGLEVTGVLTLGETSRPITFTVATTDGALTATVSVRQTDWGITPYSTLFGTLKVADVVEVAVKAADGLVAAR